jgi:CxxC motif-containing protein (DUF1111 family)
MRSEHLVRQRRWAGVALLALVGLGVVWVLSPGMPILWGPHARTSVREEGRALFEHEWQQNDPLAEGGGLGPVFNARSCVACHSQGGIGGGGPPESNVTEFEIHPTRRDPKLHTGALHTEAIDPALKENGAILHALYPDVKGRTKRVCGTITQIPDFNPVRLESINTPALFGAGWIDRISEKAISQNRMKRLLVNTKADFSPTIRALPVGRPRILSDGRVGKFGWKAQFATLEEFVANACANEIGLGTPLQDKVKPLGRPNYPAPKTDLTRKQFNALLAYVDTLPRPQQIMPDDEFECDRVAHGKQLFDSVGCASCHQPDIGGLKGVYSDFLLYKIDRPRPEGSDSYGGQDTTGIPPFPEDQPAPEEWKTPPLWGVADSAPYFHDGRTTTLESAIMRHAGEAEQVRQAYDELSSPDKEAIIAFLKTLRAPADADPVKTKVQVALR